MPRLGHIVRAALPYVMGVTILLASRASLADHYRVPTGSMQPTVEIDDRVIVDKRAYGLRIPFTQNYFIRYQQPDVGDVVVLDIPHDDIVYLKRVVAGPQDEVTIRGGRIWLNHELLTDAQAWMEDGHRVRLSHGGGRDFGPQVLGEDEYLVLGDNRGESKDGRYFGLVPADAILGRVEGVYRRDSSFTWIPLRDR